MSFRADHTVVHRLQGVKKIKGAPNPHLYNSLAVLAGESGFVEEARAWFKQGTSSVRVSHVCLALGSYCHRLRVCFPLQLVITKTETLPHH